MEQNDHVRNRTRLRLFYLGLKAKHAAWRRRGTWGFTKKMVKWIWVHSHPKRYHQLSLLDLPLDILLLIFPLLSLLSQACLALTCKPFYCLCGHVLKDNSLAWPRLVRPYEAPLNRPDLPRNQFLLLLEDDCWLYCSRCLKLHPRCRFWDRSGPPLRRVCKYNGAGVVDLCPCLSLTFFDRNRLERSLRKGVLDTSLSSAIQEAFQISTRDGKRSLIHRCSIVDHADAFITLTMVITFNTDHNLVLQSRYNLHFNRPQPSQGTHEMHSPLPDMEPVLFCPELDILEFLHKGYRLQSFRTCSICSAFVLGSEATDDGLFVVVHCIRYMALIDWWGATRRPSHASNSRCWCIRHALCPAARD